MSKAIIVACLTLALAGCSGSPKQSKGSSTTGSNPFLSSSKQVQQDLTQTQTDVGKLESQVHFAK